MKLVKIMTSSILQTAHEELQDREVRWRALAGKGNIFTLRGRMARWLKDGPWQPDYLLAEYHWASH